MGSVLRFKEFIDSKNVRAEVREFDSSTKSSALAATVLGCTIAEIAKSVVLTGKDRVYVVVISGDKRVDTAKVSALVGEPVRVANAQEVKERTGYVAGGVPPFPHGAKVTVLPDSSLARFSAVWAAAGSQSAVFRIATADLLSLIGKPVQNLATEGQRI